MNNMYDKFINLYPVSKTLRFELRPQGNTLEKMKENGVLESDEHRAESYKRAKNIMDEYHKYFIDCCLKKYKIDDEKLNQYYELVNDKSRKKEELDKVKSDLRKEISNCFIKNKEYNNLFKKEIITKYIPAFIKDPEDLAIIKEYEKFTTYFSGFYENRKNMYSEEKSTSIAYRIIDENLPIFISNLKAFEYINEILEESKIKEIYNNLEEIIQVNELKEMFELKYFNDVLTQRGIDVYNQIIGGIAKEDGKKIKGLNEYINEYKQNHPNDKKIAKLNILHKQILSDSETASFIIEMVESDQQLLKMLKNLSDKINKEILNGKLESLLKDISKYNLEKIYIRNNLAITEISQYLYDDWNVINSKIIDFYDNEYKDIKSKIAIKQEKYEENRKKVLKSKKNLSIKYLNECTNTLENYKPIESYFENCNKNSNKDMNQFEKVINSYKKIEKLLNSEYNTNKNLKEDYESIAQIKEYLDELKELQLFIKPLVGVRYDIDVDKDNEFYDELNKYWDMLQELTIIYNKVRNYLTGKPYSKDKIKLNFNNDKLLSGWAKGNEIANSSLIFNKDDDWYLGIINNEYNSNFKNFIEPKDEKDTIMKMRYIQTADPQKDVQNLMVIDGKTVKKNGRKNEFGENTVLEELKNKYLPQQINNIRLKKSYSTQSDNFNKKDLEAFIDYYKERVKEYYNEFEFEFKDSLNYRDFGEFTNDINEQAYQISYEKVSKEWLENLVEEGKLYLFQIYNKDFSKNSHGTPNLHTLYWKMLFDKNNLENVVYKLNGNAEVFYRKASIKREITHPKNQKINNKNENNPKKQSEFSYDLIKDKRYTEDKFQFHVPITLNYKNVGITNINEQMKEAIKNNDENYIIGIDRGERHLLYLTLIDSKGKIIEQFTLNKIENEYNGVKHTIDYHKLLDYKEREREKARESWQSIENIKELKEGYLSQVISKITDLMIKYNAIVVLEDLNFGFIRGRQKVEKQVYQKFEKMLIDKLNYLVKKNRNINENGGLLKAYQLTNQFTSFQKLGKQSGALFYIPAWNTSKMDPVTGFVNLFYVRYENEIKAKEFTNKIDNIQYNSAKGYFEFDIDYNKFTNKAEGTKTKWKLCTYGTRIKTFRNLEKNSKWDNKEVVLSDEFIKLFNKFNIDYKSANLKSEILNIKGKEFWVNFIDLFKLMLQMRNSISGGEIDYIISPVANKNGEFFNSMDKNPEWPQDADANGAYNIARKGLWIINQIKNTPNDKLKNMKLAISNKEWLQFIQNNE